MIGVPLQASSDSPTRAEISRFILFLRLWGAPHHPATAKDRRPQRLREMSIRLCACEEEDPAKGEKPHGVLDSERVVRP